MEDIEKLGKQLTTVNGTYEDAVNKMTRGKGNLVSQAQRFVDLGVKVKKEIPKSITEKSDIETDIEVVEQIAIENSDNKNHQAGT